MESVLPRQRLFSQYGLASPVLAKKQSLALQASSPS